MKKSILLCITLLFPFFAQAQEITISAAASLSNAFTELKEEFIKENQNITIYTNFASSNNLLKQIEQGAPVDIFASADQETMNIAQQKNCIDETSRVDFVKNELVLITPKNNNSINDYKDLIKAHSIAIGSINSVPAGRYAQNVLKKLQLWDKLQNKFIYGEHVRQVLDYVKKEEVDAGFVYKTDAFIAKNFIKIIPITEQSEEIIYPIALTKNTPNKEIAQQFINFILSNKGQSILEKYGFSKP